MDENLYDHVRPGWFLKLRNGSLICADEFCIKAGDQFRYRIEHGVVLLSWKHNGMYYAGNEESPFDIVGAIPPRSVMVLTVKTVDAIERSLLLANSWIERDEVAHGREFGAGVAVRESMESIRDAKATRWTC